MHCGPVPRECSSYRVGLYKIHRAQFSTPCAELRGWGGEVAVASRRQSHQSLETSCEAGTGVGRGGDCGRALHVPFSLLRLTFFFW